MPGVEGSGEIDEGLEAELVEEIRVVDGEGIRGRYAAPLRCFLLQRLHDSLAVTLLRARVLVSTSKFIK